jgi:serine phosphatase RsbU (regulator of sigma subunit)
MAQGRENALMMMATAPDSRSRFPAFCPEPGSSILQLICSISTAILQATAPELEQALEKALAAIGQFLGLDNTYLHLYSETGDRIEKTFEWTRGGPTSRRRLTGLRLCPFVYTMRLVHQQQPMVLSSIDDLPERAKSERLLWSITGTKSLLGNPLNAQGVLIGYFGLSSRETNRSWTDKEVELSRLLAGLFAHALSRFRSERRVREAKANELRIAAEIQRSLLSPVIPARPFPVEVGISTLPSRSVDGDFIDIFRDGSDTIDLIMGDSMGKGVPAALMSAATKIAILRARAEGLDPSEPLRESVCAIFRRVQEEMGGKLVEMSAFVTLAFVRFFPDRGTLQMLNAGHPPILIWRQALSTVDVFESQNPPIGIPSRTDALFHEIQVGPGDVVLIYSDGLTDARNDEGVFFGVPRLVEILQSIHYLPAQEIADRLFRLSLAFLGERQFHDDFSCLVVSIP